MHVPATDGGFRVDFEGVEVAGADEGFVVGVAEFEVGFFEVAVGDHGVVGRGVVVGDEATPFLPGPVDFESGGLLFEAVGVFFHVD